LIGTTKEADIIKDIIKINHNFAGIWYNFCQIKSLYPLKNYETT